MRYVEGIILFSIFAFLLLAGCASTNPQENATVENIQPNITLPQENVAIQETAPQEPAPQFQSYSGPFFSFDYPTGMKTSDMMKNDSEGNEYGGVQVSGKEGVVLLFWREYVPENASLETDLAILNLKTFEKDGDPLKLLDNSTNKSNQEMHAFVIQGFGGEGNLFARKVAEMSFEKEENGTTLYGYALEYYEPSLDRMVSVRISSETPENAKMLRDEFFYTFMFNGWGQVLGSS
jgi:hypothetical protein